MKILVLNSGSSSIKSQLFIEKRSEASILIERIGESKSYAEIKTRKGKITHEERVADHHEALKLLFSLLKKDGMVKSVEELDAVGHRVVHGGARFDRPTLVTDEVVDAIRELIPLAPLHNPANLEGITVLKKIDENLPQVAVFDTAFHQTMPEESYLYPLPLELYEKHGVRRYGFHGSSHSFVAKEAARMLGKALSGLNLITLHLGNGASATAIQRGSSIDTSMGLTPLEGLMMGTRCGDIDPAIIPFVSENLNLGIESIDKMLNKESGLKGVCGSNDMREVLQKARNGDEKSQTAAKMYALRIKKYIGAYSALLGRVDAVVFTGGIGEHAAKIREMACEGLKDSIGLMLDARKNENTSGNESIESPSSKIKVLVVQTNEELEIAVQTEELLLAAK